MVGSAVVVIGKNTRKCHIKGVTSRYFVMLVSRYFRIFSKAKWCLLNI